MASQRVTKSGSLRPWDNCALPTPAARLTIAFLSQGSASLSPATHQTPAPRWRSVNHERSPVLYLPAHSSSVSRGSFVHLHPNSDPAPNKEPNLTSNSTTDKESNSTTNSTTDKESNSDTNPTTDTEPNSNTNPTTDKEPNSTSNETSDVTSHEISNAAANTTGNTTSNKTSNAISYGVSNAATNAT